MIRLVSLFPLIVYFFHSFNNLILSIHYILHYVMILEVQMLIKQKFLLKWSLHSNGTTQTVNNYVYNRQSTLKKNKAGRERWVVSMQGKPETLPGTQAGWRRRRVGRMVFREVPWAWESRAM